MSGIFSIAAHCALQYFSVVMQVQFGCTHFCASVAMVFSFYFELGRSEQRLG
jgi:hypothetical protein